MKRFLRRSLQLQQAIALRVQNRHREVAVKLYDR